MTAQTVISPALTEKSTSSGGLKGEQDVDLGSESVAGEEDPGAALDMTNLPASTPPGPAAQAPDVPAGA